MSEKKDKVKEDWIVDNIPEMTIGMLIEYMRKLQKYDDEAVIKQLEVHLIKSPKTDYITLRPNGVTGIISNGVDPIRLQKKYYKWGNEWIKIKR